MYSLGMRGSWWENTFCSPTSQSNTRRLALGVSELPMTWNSMMPRRSSRRAVSSRAALADSRLVWAPEEVVSWGLRLARPPPHTVPRAGLPHLRPQHGGRVSDGEHDLVDQLHRDVAHYAKPLGILQGQVLWELPLLTCWEGWQGLRWTAREVRGGLNESQR